MSRRALARILPAALFGALVVIAVLFSTLGGGGDTAAASPLSTQGPGTYVAWRLAAELGFAPELWRDAPGLLPRGPHTLVLFQAPEDPPGYEPEPDGAATGGSGTEPGLARRLRDPAHYLRFVEEGGTLLAAYGPKMRRFLVDRLHVEELEGVVASVREAHTLYGPMGEEITTDDQSTVFTVPPRRTSITPVFQDSAGRAFLLRVPIGRGALALFASLEPFTNAHIEEADHALLWVRVLEEVHGSGRLLFDEYALGGWKPETPLSLALSAPYRGATLHLVGLLLLAAWTVLRGGPFAREVDPWMGATALDRVRAHAALTARAGRWHLAARVLVRETLRVLERGGRPRPEGYEAAPDRARVEAALAPHAQRLGGPGALEEACGLLLGPEPGSAAELETLARRLSALEQRMAPAEAPAATGTRRHGRRASAR